MRSRRFSRSPQRRWPSLGGLAALLTMTACALCGPAGAQDLLVVRMDKAKLVKYPSETDTVVIGNPLIADVTMLRSSGMLVVTGKGYGETNMILLDRDGSVLTDTTLRVEAPTAVLIVQRGASRETYSCHPRCEPTVAIGDVADFSKDALASIAARNSAAAPQGNPISGASSPH